MNTFYLKFEDETQAVTELSACYPAFESEIVKQGTDYFIDIVGEIPVQVDVTDDGVPIFEMLEGYHVNILALEIPESLESFAVDVDSPVRVFAC